MRLLVPRRFRDESLSSLWTRMCLNMSLPITAVTSQIVGRKWTPGFFQAGHITQTAELFGIAPEKLLMRHTVFPYATAFVAPKVRETALRNALSTGACARGAGAVTQSVSDQVDSRRYCRECAREEFELTGESFWHRSHNLPGVFVCLRHKCLLYEVPELQTNGNRSWSYKLPHQSLGHRISRTPPFARLYLYALADLSVEALEEPYGRFASCTPEWYRNTLLTRGLLSEGSQVDGNALAEFVAQGARRCLPESMTRLHSMLADGRWALPMLRPRSGVPFIPLKHLLLQTALTLGKPIAAERGSLDYRAKPHYTGRPRGGVDERGAALVHRLVNEAIASNRKLTVPAVLKAANCWQLYRHSRDDFPLVAAEVVRLRGSSASLRRTSARRIAMVKSRRHS